MEPRGKRRTRSQRIGEKGEALYKTWAVDNCLTSQKIEQDYGVDFFSQILRPLEGSIEEVTGGVLAVQVRSVEGIHRKRVKIDKTDAENALRLSVPFSLVAIDIAENKVYHRFLNEDFFIDLNEFIRSSRQSLTMRVNSFSYGSDRFRTDLALVSEQGYQYRLRILKAERDIISDIPGTSINLIQKSNFGVAKINIPYNFYAHSLPDKPVEKWQPLEEHLQNVAKLAAEFARTFGGDQWAGLAGLWHDLGKYSEMFQQKLYAENGIEAHLETKPEKVVHSEAGGHLGSSKGWNGADRVLSWLIMGHHAGLTDYSSDEIGAKALEPKMQRKEQSEQIFSNIPNCIVEQEMPRQPIPLGADPAFFIRMLFSCLVDADYLDTEAFMNKSKSGLRNREHPDLRILLSAFDSHMDTICNNAEQTKVNQIRAEILEQCRIAADKKPNVFSLSVPTGGGKTLSSMAFALRHAVTYDKRRIIYVIPYTSIIEQTADVFRKIPGFENAVVEHHCNVVETSESKESLRNRLVAENWDAPIIVTTAVQFFESLFACRTSRCRKLHNIVDSVVIFDEAQCLPPKYLRPVVFAIRELHRHYGVTPLLCTATQPVLTRTEQFDFKFREGFEQEPVPLFDKPDDLVKRLQRINVELYGGSLQPVGYEKIAESIVEEGRSVLCIVNRKEDAHFLSQLLPKNQAIHLSTNMCAEHRSQTLEHIKNRLRTDKEPFWVISTSLVEAGVDIDFPIVYRALAGLDSIAQAAGRCNREGKLSGLGKVVVFVPKEQPDYARQPAFIAGELLSGKDLATLLLPANYEAYFRRRFWLLGEQALDEKDILKLSSGRGMNYYFRTAASRFKFIEDEWQQEVIAPYGKAFELIDRISRENWNEKILLRKLQRYSVSIPGRLFEPLSRRDYIRESTQYPGLFILDFTLYDDDYGFVPPDKSEGIDPKKFMV